jgi:hypothetical protein
MSRRPIGKAHSNVRARFCTRPSKLRTTFWLARRFLKNRGCVNPEMRELTTSPVSYGTG